MVRERRRLRGPEQRQWEYQSIQYWWPHDGSHFKIFIANVTDMTSQDRSLVLAIFLCVNCYRLKHFVRMLDCCYMISFLSLFWDVATNLQNDKSNWAFCPFRDLRSHASSGIESGRHWNSKIILQEFCTKTRLEILRILDLLVGLMLWSTYILSSTMCPAFFLNFWWNLR